MTCLLGAREALFPRTRAFQRRHRPPLFAWLPFGWQYRARRAEAADSFRLRTLLEHYDRRVITTNNWMWSSTFTRGGNSSRQDWSEPLPRSHVDFLRSLPLRLRLDVTALLTARVAFRHSLPRQVRACSSETRRERVVGRTSSNGWYHLPQRYRQNSTQAATL